MDQQPVVEGINWCQRQVVLIWGLFCIAKMSYNKDMTNQTKKEFLYYLGVGMLGNVIDVAVFVALYYLGFSTVLTQWGASLVGNTHNHLWHFFKIFDHDQGFSKTYILTLILAFILILISGPLLATINSVIENIWISKALMFPVTGLIGYLIRKFYIFRKTKIL